MRSRFWLGRTALEGGPGIVNRVVGSPLVARRAVSLQQGRDLVVHCGMEMNHLAGFLPDLWAEYHPGR